MWPFSKSTDDDDNSDYDSDGNFVPGPGFYNVTPVSEPVDLLAYDDQDALYLKNDGSYLLASRVENEGDE
jgi:hypothetical protein